MPCSPFIAASLNGKAGDCFGAAYPLLSLSTASFMGFNFPAREAYREKLVAKRDFSRKSRSDRVSERASPLDLAASRAASATTRWVGLDKEAHHLFHLQGVRIGQCAGWFAMTASGRCLLFPSANLSPVFPSSAPGPAFGKGRPVQACGPRAGKRGGIG